MAVQDIFYTLDLVDVIEGDLYVIAKKTLTKCFTSLSNIPYERHNFWSIALEPNETIEQHITLLRPKTETCEFTDDDEQIRHQVVENVPPTISAVSC